MNPYLTTVGALTTSLVILIGTRFLGMMVFLEFYIQKRKPKYLLLLLGWLTMLLGSIWGLYSHLAFDVMERTYFSMLSGLGTFWVGCGILLYLQEIDVDFPNFGKGIIVIGSAIIVVYGLLPVFGVVVGPSPGVYIQVFVSLIITLGAIIARRSLITFAESSYYWLVIFSIASIGLTLAFAFSGVQPANLAFGFIGTSFVLVVAIIFFLHLENNLSSRQLRTSEKRLMMFMENAQDLIYRYDLSPERRFSYVSPSVFAITGYTPEEHYADPDLRQILVHPDDRHLLEAMDQGKIRKDKTLTLRWIKKDGSVIWCEQHNLPIFDENGTLVAVEGIARDITVQRIAEQQYQFLFTEMLDGFALHEIILDENGKPVDYRFLAINPAFERLTGLKGQEIIGHSVLEVLPNTEPFWIEMYGSVALTGKPAHFTEYSRELEKYYEVRCFRPIENQFATIFMDVTERIKTKKMLEENEEKYRLLVENQNDLIVKVDPDGRFLYVSPSCCHLFDKTEAELLGTKFTSLVHADDLDKTLQAMETLKHPPHTCTIEQRALTKLGWRWLSWSDTAVMNEDGEMAEIIGHGVDITARKEVEDALVENERILQIALINSPVTVYQQDANLKYTWIHNPQDDSTAQEMIGKTDAECFTPEDAERLMGIKHRVLATGKGERQIVKAVGEGLPLFQDLTVEPIYDSEGAISGLTCSSVDITRFELADEAQKQRLAELEALMNITQILQVARSVDEALPVLLREILDVLHLPAGCIYLHDPINAQFTMVAAEGWFEDLQDHMLRTDDSITGMVFSSGEFYYTDEFATDPYVNVNAIEKIPPGWNGVAIPIRALDETIGVFFVSSQVSQAIQPFNVQLLEALSGMAGISLHRMTLLEDAMFRLEKLKSQRTIDQAVAGMTDMALTVEIICEQALTRLPADAVGLLLYSPHDQTLKFAASAGFQTDSYQNTRIKLGEGLAGKAALDHRSVHVEDDSFSDLFLRRPNLISGDHFRSYTGIPLIAKGQLKGFLEVFHDHPIQHDVEWNNVLETLASQTAVAIDTLQMYERLERNSLELTQAYDATIEGWSLALDLRDNETEGHSLRVTDLTLKLAKAMGVKEEDLVHIRRGALLHDMGKLGIPDSILSKPGALNEEEWKIIKQHPRLAYDMLSPISYLRPALDIPYYHHEKWDGTGYPSGLKGEQIPLAARIFAVVDVWDALTSDRPYRAAWTVEETLKEIQSLSGTHFDPKVVEAFLQVIPDRPGETG